MSGATAGRERERNRGSEAPEVSPKRVLIAEDNPVTQNLLRRLLKQRGHMVDIAEDGAKALQALQDKPYDVVLMDFHLPKMDGLQVTAKLRSILQAERQPRFIAITADMEGLLAHAENCETFDGFVPKPFDIDHICQIVEDQPSLAGSLAEPAPAAPAVAPLQPRRQPDELREADGSKKFGCDVLLWPEDFSADQLSARAIRASLAGGEFGAIVVEDRCSLSQLAQIWTVKALHRLPVIDMTGSLGRYADVDASRLAARETGAIPEVIRAFEVKRAQMHHDLIFTASQGEKLLGRIYVAGGSLKIFYDPASRLLAGFSATLDPAAAEQEAANLYESGFLQRTFFDRLNVCVHCGSSRCHVREECAKCRSPHLSEEAYLHHYRCAYQGPESDFRRGDELICPKCRRELTHFSVDYDKPGHVLRCAACGHATSEPSIGLLCLDCGAHTGGEAAKTRDVFSYEMTERGLAFVQTGRTLLGRRDKTLRLAEMPLELIIAIGSAMRAHEEAQTPFAVLDIAYRREKDIVSEHGAREFERARSLFLQNLKDILSKHDVIVRGRIYDFALLKNTSPEEARDGAAGIVKEASHAIRHDLGVVTDVFGPKDFA